MISHTATVPGPNSWRIPDFSATYEPERGSTGQQLGHAQEAAPLPHLIGEVEFEHMIDTPHKAIDKIERMFSWTDADGGRILEGWIICVAPAPQVPAPVAIAPHADQSFIQPQQARPPPGTLWLGIMTPGIAQPKGDPIRDYYELVPNTAFRLPAYSILAAGRFPGSPGAPVLPVNRLLLKIRRIVAAAAAGHPAQV